MANPSAAPEPVSDLPRESTRAILFQFVVFPLGIVAVGVLIFLLFGVLASERDSIRDELNDLRSGSSHQRWQAAYQLSKSLKRGEAKQFPNLYQDVSALYVEAKTGDPKIRRYLGMVLGNLGDRRATPVLIDGLRDADPETRIYAALALGELRDPRAAVPLNRLTRDAEPDVRKTAVYVLGVLRRPESVPALVEALSDEVPDVRWNAAVALARFGDRRALPVLREMLDRTRLSAVEGMREDQKETAMIGAISAWTSLLGRQGADAIRPIAESDPNLRVRSAAKEALETR